MQPGQRNPAATPAQQTAVDRLIAKQTLELLERRLAGRVAKADIRTLARDQLITIAQYLHDAGYRKAAAAIRSGIEGVR